MSQFIENVELAFDKDRGLRDIKESAQEKDFLHQSLAQRAVKQHASLSNALLGVF